MFNKALIAEKDARIADLKEQVEFLRAQICGFEQNNKTNADAGIMEANALLDGTASEQIIQPNPVDARILAEANALLNGTY